jgi:hypothetical protein
MGNPEYSEEVNPCVHFKDIECDQCDPDCENYDEIFNEEDEMEGEEE